MGWQVTVDRDQLLEIVRANREKHSDIVSRALDAYRAAVIEEVERQVQLVRERKENTIFVQLAQPRDYTNEYDVVIGMLEMSTDDTVSLGVTEYASYVLGRWEWKEQWARTTTNYVDMEG